MASYHFTAKAGSKGKGASASIHAEYILREGKYSSRTDLENTGSGNMPEWAKDNPIEFWRAADLFERKNGVVYREHELALPMEATPEQRKKIIDTWCARQYVNHAYLYAIHGKAGNPHAHIMICDREYDGIERDFEHYFKREASTYRDRKTKELRKADPTKGGCRKSPKWNGPIRSKHLEEMRKAWAKSQNNFYKSIGLDLRVDHRTLKAQRKEALEDIENLRVLGNSPEVMAVLSLYKEKAAALDRNPDQRINHRRYRIMQRRGQLSDLNDFRTASRNLTAAKADLQSARERQYALYKQQQIARAARASAWEAEQSRRARYRANSRTIKAVARLAANVLPTPLSEVVQIAAEALALVTKINDWTQAHKYRLQVERLRAEIDQAREERQKAAAAQSAGQQPSLNDTQSLFQQPVVEVYGPNSTASALLSMAKQIADKDMRVKTYRLAAHVEKLPPGTIIYQGPCTPRPAELYNCAVTAVNYERQLKLQAQALSTVRSSDSHSQPGVKCSKVITGTPSMVARQYRDYAQLIAGSEPDKACTLAAICNCELGNIPNSKEITLPHPSSELKEIREALKQHVRTGGRKR